MKLRIFQVDAFASAIFRGNPAAVVPLGEWLPDRTMQSIALENNLSETAFVVGSDGRYAIRWFTPANEVDLCGHATLAAAHVVITALEREIATIEFETRSAGILRVSRDGDKLALDFPARPPVAVHDSQMLQHISRALGTTVRELHKARDLLAVVDNAETLRRITPNFAVIAELDAFALIVTAAGADCDFVSRFFAPRQGILEDPVTGSAHCTLIPFWAERLRKHNLFARQLSARGGELWCTLAGDRVKIAGCAFTYLEGEITIPDSAG